MTVPSAPLPLPRATPESQGVSSELLLGLIDAVERNDYELHSLMLLRHGQVIAEGWWNPYRAETPHRLHSITKSFTSTAVGFAIAEGRLLLDDPVLGFFPEFALANPGEHLKAMRVRHLLSMSTGQEHDIYRTPEFSAANRRLAFIQCPVVNAPGAHFLYNSGASYMLAAIVQRVTGQRLLHYLTQKLFDPLGITGAAWETCVSSVDCGAAGLKLKTEDVARFGQFYLQKGVWDDMQLLEERWVDQATTLQIMNGERPDSDWSQGYGYQFWRCRHNAYAALGAFGQLCLILPEQGAVVVITAGVDDYSSVVDLLWDHLLPALKPSPLPINPAGESALRQRLASLKLRGPGGKPESPFAARFSGGVFSLDENRRGYTKIGFDFSAGFCRIRLHNARGEHRIACRTDGEWQRTASNLRADAPARIAVTGAWLTPLAFAFRLAMTETAYCPTILCQFEGRRLRLRYQRNVDRDTEPDTEILGRRE